MIVHGKGFNFMEFFLQKHMIFQRKIFIGLISIILFAPVLQTDDICALEASFVNEVGMEFILVHPGGYIMGSPVDEPFRSRNEPQHRVEIKKAFYMQATEVTLKQWHSIMPKKSFILRKGADDMPVTRVSYYNCRRFVGKLSRRTNQTYRLPTEEEWEYVCRAGTTTAYSFGDTVDCTKAMFGNNSLKCTDCIEESRSRGLELDKPAPVKSYPPNPWGFYDMHGNVWEWVSDAYHGYLAQDDGVLPGRERSWDTRIKRGGSWFMYGHYCRSANRAWAHPGGKFKTTGFRVVLEVAK
ncbi:Formylglycine-generating enzyme, required for sulfatase activity, contains SUMF1/FGE domain [Desulfocicer vacuolatum DSM 3385]|uniref:Formylglycine-generating enzyme, required for sulfatase activity, contains SUMF1/FGE domain n=1 Tax=Desulfocicer vacuolatum DSM 3385 TaxID=1121400 RepID=A0A1W2CYQ0_9BACT|nr:formylglycine-generating enzyme family protein [Desulfocicer vacuolatum]SMC90323.1 Formylglycine-generating enzyme, required for sulfatase activity, contains SUMF1/FGE domain [Desulfocicer vacuolatum DSM 3385]